MIESRGYPRFSRLRDLRFTTKGIKGEAVVVYGEPLITPEMGYHRLSWKVNKMGFFK